jgi:hypothetical protein
MRNKKKRGGKGGTASLSQFDQSDYNTVMGKYHQWLLSPKETPVEPENPVGERMIAAYQTALCKVYKDQVAHCAMSPAVPLLGTQFGCYCY